MPRIRVTLNIGYLDAEHEGVIEIDDDEWADCETEDDKESLINEYWKDWAWNFIDGSHELIDEQ